MKRHKIIPICFSSLLFALTACDRIEPEEYTIFDGVQVGWSTPGAAPEAVQRAYVEKYTGPKCSNCPRADETLDAAHHIYGDRLVMVSINHPTSQGEPFSGEPDMRTPGGTAWDHHFGINALPSAYLNRNVSTPPYQGDMASITDAIGSAIAQTPTAAIVASASVDGTVVSVDVDIQLLQDFGSPLTLTAALIEDSLVYKQLLVNGQRDPNYVHNHMLRMVITSNWGADLPEGQSLMRGSFRFTPNDDIKLENSHIVVFLSDKSSRQVINSASCPINL